jgi:hypothetical protein
VEKYVVHGCIICVNFVERKPASKADKSCFLRKWKIGEEASGDPGLFYTFYEGGRPR